MLRTLGTYLGILVGGIIMGVLIALLMMSKQEARQVAAEARTVVSTTADSVVEAVKENSRIETTLDAGKASTEAVKASVGNQIKPPKEVVYVEVRVPGKTEVQVCPAINGDSAMPLSNHSVRLLNDLRAYRTVDLAAINPSEVQATSGVTVAEFVSNDTDVVGLYNELATRHDALVDAVIAYMNRQKENAKDGK